MHFLSIVFRQLAKVTISNAVLAKDVPTVELVIGSPSGAWEEPATKVECLLSFSEYFAKKEKKQLSRKSSMSSVFSDFTSSYC